MSDEKIEFNDSRNRFVQEALKPIEHAAETGEMPRENQVRRLPSGQWRVAHEEGTVSGFADTEIRAGDHLLNHVATHRERRDDGTLILREEYAERNQQGELQGSREVVWEATGEASAAARAMGYAGLGHSRQLVSSRFTSTKQFAISLPDDYQYGPNSPYRKET